MFLFSLCILLRLSITVTLNWECSTCRTVVNHFIDEFKRTEGKNFGGGNTLWEQEKLGSYSSSETRFHDIMENICSSTSLKVSECHRFVGENEHTFENWWTSEFRNEPKSLLKIEEYVCVKVIKACCPFGFYGSTCSPCLPCNANGGSCDGNGTRSGSGKCTCFDGYVGQSCAECNTGTHYTSNTTSESVPMCIKCHEACQGGCTGPSAHNCSRCAAGWSLDGSECIDINECETVKCPSRQFCINTAGSYRCEACDQSCESCGGPKQRDCIVCAAGYQRGEGGLCEDINECSADSNVCQGVGERCINTAGSYLCECKDGFEKASGSCKPIVSPSQSSDTSIPSISDIYKEERHINTVDPTIKEDTPLNLETQKSEL